MNPREWALILYTILTQMAVGSFVVLGICHFVAQRRAGAEEADRLSDRALLAIGPVVVLAILVSLFHLGNPINAVQAVAQVGSSSLSREILFSILFAGAGAVFAIMQWRKISTFAVRNLVAWVAALLGVVLVYVMSSVYTLRTVPTWNSLATPASFYTTTFLLGALAIGAAFVANYAYMRRQKPDCAETQCSLLRTMLRGIAISAMALLAIELITIPMQLTYMAAASAGSAEAALYTQYGVLFAIRLVLVVLGAGVAALFVYRNALSAGREQTMGNLAYAAFALALVAELVGRFLFYATRTNIGL